VVIFSITVSLLDATTVVPMLGLKVDREKDVIAEAHPELRKQLGIKSTWLTAVFDQVGIWFHRLDESYRKGLGWAIHHRIPIIESPCLPSVRLEFSGRLSVVKTFRRPIPEISPSM